MLLGRGPFFEEEGHVQTKKYDVCTVERHFTECNHRSGKFSGTQSEWKLHEGKSTAYATVDHGTFSLDTQ